MSQNQFNQPMQGQTAQSSQYQPSPGGGQGGQLPAGSPNQHSPGAGGQSGTAGAPRGRLFPTKNYLSEDVRGPIGETLNRLLADTTVLFTHAKFAHWNVKGMEFYSLHLLFDEIAEMFEHQVDEIGERITALGARAMGTAGMAVSNCRLPSMPTDAMTGAEFVEILADRLAIHDGNLNDGIQIAQDYGDPDTADLLNEISRDVSQQLWFLEAHLQTRPSGPNPAPGAGGQGRVQNQRGQ